MRLVYRRFEPQIKIYHFYVKCWKFHWKFWKPIECTGGNVYFGYYAVIHSFLEDKFHGLQTPLQVQIKREMGLLK